MEDSATAAAAGDANTSTPQAGPEEAPEGQPTIATELEHGKQSQPETTVRQPSTIVQQPAATAL